MARYCHWGDGHSFRTVDPNYQPEPGEVVFDQPFPGTPEQLAAAFPDYVGAQSRKDVLQAIGDLERQATPRRNREAILGTDGGWLKKLDGQIAALRKGLAL